MKIIEQVIATTEKKLNDKLDKIQKAIDFNPFSEAVVIADELKSLVEGGVDDTYLDRLEALRIRSEKNDKDIKKVTKPNYSENLYKKLGEVEDELNQLNRFKMYTNILID